jgi:uncharacterized membrane protein
MSDTLIASKILAAIGSILLCLSFIPIIGNSFTPILGIIGIILIFSGMKGLAEHYHDGNIYRNAFTGAIFGVICLIIIAINEFVSFTVTGIFVTDLINRILNPSVGMFDIQYFILNTPYFIPFLTIVFIFNLLMAVYFNKAFHDIAKRSGERLFNTAGTMMIIGAILTLAFFVGLILTGIAAIIAAAAFCIIKTKPTTTTTPPPDNYTQQQQQPPPTTQTITLEAKYCPHCGAPLAPGTAFCTQCGKQI